MRGESIRGPEEAAGAGSLSPMPTEKSASAAGEVAPGEPDALAALLIDAERRLAVVPELEARVADLEAQLAVSRHETEVAREEAQRLDQMLMYGRRLLRYVRPLIQPLRQARRRRAG
jgi:hypothetical protein